MSSDLFDILFQKFSKWSYESYRRNYLNRLAYRFLKQAECTHAALHTIDSYREVCDLLVRDSGSFSLNPELYPYLNHLVGRDATEASMSVAVRAIRIHCGLALPDRTKAGERGFWRIRFPTPSVIKVCPLGENTIDGAILPAEDLENIILYAPVTGLFNDIEPRYYKATQSLGDTKEQSLMVDQAFRMIDRYSATLARNIKNRLKVIALMDRRSERPVSFSMRNYYVGGIFISEAAPCQVAEQIIHEYYHQQLWPWWLAERPDGLPSDEFVVVSPISGQRRAAGVMFQAAIIYTALRGFFLACSRGSDYASDYENSYVETRLNSIEDGLPKLLRLLRKAIPLDSEARQQLDYLSKIEMA